MTPWSEPHRTPQSSQLMMGRLGPSPKPMSGCSARSGTGDYAEPGPGCRRRCSLVISGTTGRCCRLADPRVRPALPAAVGAGVWTAGGGSRQLAGVAWRGRTTAAGDFRYDVLLAGLAEWLTAQDGQPAPE